MTGIKRWIAMGLAICMLTTSLPLTALATEVEEEDIFEIEFLEDELTAEFWEDEAFWMEKLEEEQERTVAAYNTTGTAGDCYWVYNASTQTLTISGDGDMGTMTSSRNFSDYTWSGDLKTVIIENGVTSIGSYAFYFCSSLTSVIIGDSVTSIGFSAFGDCSSLTSVTIPDSVTSIGTYAFVGCSSLTSIEVDDKNQNFTSIDGVLFNADKSILVIYPAGKTATVYSIPDSVTSIRGWSFYGCSSLTSVTIGDSVTSIGDYAFRYCSSLTSVTIGDSVTSIGDYAFSPCTSLTSIEVDVENQYYSSSEGVLFNANKSTLIAYPAGKTSTKYIVPNSVTSIGNYAFRYCTALTNITIPDSVTSIGSSAFYYCTALTNITIPDSVTSIGNYAFGDCRSLTSITIPDSVTSIGNYAFCDCNFLTSVTIGDSVTSIGNYAFRYCRSLTSITIPDSVTSIGDSAFSYCTALTNITIPDSVTSIGATAFYYCTSLTDVYYTGTEVQWDAIFIGYNTCLTDATIHYNYTESDDTSSSDSSDIPGIVTLYPSNGATDVLYGSDTEEVEITFESEVVEKVSASALSGYVELDFSKEPLTIYRASDDVMEEQIFENNYLGGDVSTYVMSYSGDLSTIHIGWNGMDLDPDTEYYITMGEGFVVMADGSTCSAIEKGDWTFKTAQQESIWVRTNYASTLGWELESPWVQYSDYWFFEDSYTYDHKLATASLTLAMSAFEYTDKVDDIVTYYDNGDQYVEAFMDDLGFDNYNSVNYGAEDDDSVAIAMAAKEVDGSTIVAVALRGAGYGDGGWAGNVEVGESGTYHDGFSIAAYDVIDEIQAYIDNYKIDTDNMKIWLTGYSRSAAVANLTSSYLRTNLGIDDDDIYTYTFATPNNYNYTSAKNDTDLDNIFNIINPNDIVPIVPPSSWYFGKEGTTYYLPTMTSGYVATEYFDTVRTQFDEITNYTVAADYMSLSSAVALRTWLVGTIGDAVPSQEDYYDNLQYMLVEYFETGDKSAFDDLLNGVTTMDYLLYLIEYEYYALLASTLLDVSQTLLFNSVEREIVLALMDVALGAAAETVKIDNGFSNTALLVMMRQILQKGMDSTLLMEHWPEVYLSWMTTIDASDLTATNEFKYKSLMVACPVDVSVYDESGNLVAQIIDDVAQEIEGSTISVAVMGESDKVFILPNDQEYTIEIITTDEGTMDYTILENAGDGSVLRSTEYYDVPLAEEQTFEAIVTTEQYSTEATYITTSLTDSDEISIIYADYDSYIPTTLECTELTEEALTFDLCIGNDGAVTEGDAIVIVALYDATGKMVSTQLLTELSTGEYSVDIDSDYATGMLFLVNADYKPLLNCSLAGEL